MPQKFSLEKFFLLLVIFDPQVRKTKAAASSNSKDSAAAAAAYILKIEIKISFLTDQRIEVKKNIPTLVSISFYYCCEIKFALGPNLTRQSKEVFFLQHSLSETMQISKACRTRNLWPLRLALLSL